ncbi:MAG TPA: sugar phosphate nucleotidyltransferase [Aggregatilineaceae bacterium]|nr:sugar phosphate nucleotidyltransferase [Aggregatilineaceae bacterium]
MDEMQVAILAGGRATRLYPLTRSIPKSLVPVEGTPFARLQLELLARRGVRDVVLCVGHLADQLRRWLGDGRALNLRLAYSDEGERALGTAGALKLAEPLLRDPFFVLFGDSYLPVDYGAIWAAFQRCAALGLTVVYRNEGRYDTSDMRVEGGRVTAYDKASPAPDMVWINAGLSLLRKAALDAIPPGEAASLHALFGGLIARGELLAFETQQRFYEIGSVAGLEEFRQLVRSGGLER